MPMALPAIAAVAASAATSAALAGTVWAGTIAIGTMTWGALAASAVGMLAATVVSGLLAKKPSAPSIGPMERKQTIRQTDSPRQYAYGRVKKAGTLAFIYNSEDDKYLYMGICYASHPINSVETLYLGDDEDEILEVSTDLEVDTDYMSTGITHYKPVEGNQYRDNLWIDICLGSTSSAANNRFLSEIVQDGGDYLSTDTFQNCAMIYFKFRWNQDLYRGVPNVPVVLQGKNNIYDYRDTNTKYTVNTALCLIDYLKDSVIGLGVLDAELNTASIIAAATCKLVLNLDN